MIPFRSLLSLVLLACSPHAALPDEPKWGDLTGQLIYDGEPPERVKLQVKAGFPETLDESLIVDSTTRGLANVFVYLRPAVEAKQPLQVHPDYAEQIKQPVNILADERGYTPHLTRLHTDQLLVIQHRGRVAINVKLDSHRNGPYGVLIPLVEGDSHYRFTMPESIPTNIGCNIHPWIRAYALIRDNPYMAVTDAQGRFTIMNLPLGEHEFQFWQEKAGYLELPEVQLHSAPLAGNRQKGRLVIDIQTGENNLGEIKLHPKQFD